MRNQHVKMFELSFYIGKLIERGDYKLYKTIKNMEYIQCYEM